jgi:hypothetical protein
MAANVPVARIAYLTYSNALTPIPLRQAQR